MPESGPLLETVYVKDGWEACLIEYGSNVKLCSELLSRGFTVSEILPPDENAYIGYTFVWTKKLDQSTIHAPRIVL